MKQGRRPAPKVDAREAPACEGGRPALELPTEGIHVAGLDLRGQHARRDHGKVAVRADPLAEREV